MTLLIDLIDETGQVSKEQLEEVEKLLQFAADALEVRASRGTWTFLYERARIFNDSWFSSFAWL